MEWSWLKDWWRLKKWRKNKTEDEICYCDECLNVCLNLFSSAIFSELLKCSIIFICLTIDPTDNHFLQSIENRTLLSINKNKTILFLNVLYLLIMKQDLKVSFLFMCKKISIPVCDRSCSTSSRIRFSMDKIFCICARIHSTHSHFLCCVRAMLVLFLIAFCTL